MTPALFLKVKGLAMIPLGLLILFLPEWFIGLFGAEMTSPAAMVFIMLFGLMIAAVGVSLGTTPAGYNVRPVEALAFAIGDLAALGLLLYSINQGNMGPFGYAFVAIYAVSAIGFFSCWRVAKA